MTVKVYPGYIHGYRHHIQVLLPSTFQHRTYFIPYISVQYADITVPLKQRDKNPRRNHPLFRMLPAHQRFCTDNWAIQCIAYRLVIYLKLVLPNSRIAFAHQHLLHHNIFTHCVIIVSIWLHIASFYRVHSNPASVHHRSNADIPVFHKIEPIASRKMVFRSFIHICDFSGTHKFPGAFEQFRRKTSYKIIAFHPTIGALYSLIRWPYHISHIF